MSDTAKVMQIIIIDDDQEQADLLARALRKGENNLEPSSYPRIIKIYTDPAEAVADMPVEGPGVILCDYSLSGSTGLDWMPHLLRAGIGPVILMTSHGDERVASEAFRAGASDYLVKMDIFQTPRVLNKAIRDATVHFKLEQCNRDLSRKLKTANHSLQLKNDRLRDLTETAHRFVEDVAHEFRTPLTVIKEFASIIQDGLGGDITEKQAEYLGHIETGAQNLAQMVDDFLDTSKLQAQLLRVDRKSHRFDDVYEAVRLVLHNRARAKHMTLTEDFADDLPAVYCDKEKVGRVLINLVINAIKFSPQGGRINVWAKPEESGGIVVGVTDRGPGISEDDQAILCNRLSQTAAGRVAGIKGFGLGLNIARDLIQTNLGTLRIESKIGEGSTFAFTLPSDRIEHILDCYAETVTRRDPAVAVTVLHATPPLHKPFDVERARLFLVCHGHSLDLILPAPDGQSVLLIGPTSEAHGWINAVQNNLKQAQTQLQTHSHELEMDLKWLGTWEHPKIKQALFDCLSVNSIRNQRCA